MFDTPTTRENVGPRARAVYEASIRHLVEPQHNGKFIAIEPESGRYEIGNKTLDAALDLRAKLPGKSLYVHCIGHKAAITRVRGRVDYTQQEIDEAQAKYGDYMERGRALYDAEIRHLVEPLHSGKYLALDPDSGEYGIHEDIMKAGFDVDQGMPGKPLILFRIGYETVLPNDGND